MISTISVIITNITVSTSQAIKCGIMAVTALAAFLILKEILSSEKNKDEKIKALISGSNIIIIPLLIVFISIFIYKIITTPIKY